MNEAARLMQDVSRLTQRVQQVANGWESRLWIVTDELLEFETLIPVIHEFDALGSGVPLRITQEVLKGVWEALREGRADLIIGATNEPPAIPSLRWMQLGEMEWVFAVSPKHPLAKAREPISRGNGGAAPGDCRGRFVQGHRRQYLRRLRRATGAGRADHARENPRPVRRLGRGLAAEAPGRFVTEERHAG